MRGPGNVPGDTLDSGRAWREVAGPQLSLQPHLPVLQMPWPPCSSSSSLTSEPLYMLSPLPETFSPPSAPLSNSYSETARARGRKKMGLGTQCGSTDKCPRKKRWERAGLTKLRLKKHSFLVCGVPWWAMLLPNSLFLSDVSHPSCLNSTALPPEAHCRSHPQRSALCQETKTALYSWVGCILHNGLSSSLPAVTPGFGRRECLLLIPTEMPYVTADPSASFTWHPSART